MLTIGLYFFNMVVLLILAFRSLSYYRKLKSNFIAKNFVRICFPTAIVYFTGIFGIAFELKGMHQLAVYAGVGTMIALYLSLLATADFIRDLSGKTLPIRILKVLLVIAGIYMVVSTILIPSTATIDANGIVTAPPKLTPQSVVYALSILTTFNWSTVALIRAGLANPRIRTKLFLLAGGFLLGTWSAAALALAKTFEHFIVIYALFFLSYIIQLFAIFEKSEA